MLRLIGVLLSANKNCLSDCKESAALILRRIIPGAKTLIF
jgi:hypothetical protein